ncbi:MAG: type II toxin-antitoxin system VapC family toxin, partial [Planctomycetes bacterium]|nr:type II toxin-antitoxin system VapC family toxin [Planctomycetota bacterium]
MASFILDTGILVGYLRHAGYAEYVERKYGLLQPPNIPVISIVSKGEIYSLAIQFGWAEPRKQELAALLNKIPFVDISHDRVIHRYAAVDAYSQGKHPSRPLPDGMSSRTM